MSPLRDPPSDLRLALTVLVRILGWPVSLPLRSLARRRLQAVREAAPRVMGVTGTGPERRVVLGGGGWLGLRIDEARAASLTVYEDHRGGFAQTEERWVLTWVEADGTTRVVVEEEPPPGQDRPLASVVDALRERGRLGRPRYRDVSRPGLSDFVLAFAWAAALRAALVAWAW